MPQPTHYEVLSLPRSILDDASPDQTTQVVKRAYHRALLRHHPDKAAATAAAAAESLLSSTTSTSFPLTTSNNSNSNNNSSYTIDQIVTAYTILSSPSTRTTYDQTLRTTNNALTSDTTTFQTGIETIDLDDLSSSTSSSELDETTYWWKSCRCGNPHGFRFGEDDLEEAGDLGELIVGCQDCSLWLRVHFAVVEDDDEINQGATG